MSDVINRLKVVLDQHPSKPVLDHWMKRLKPEDYLACTSYLIRFHPNSFVRVSNVNEAYKKAGNLSVEELFQALRKAFDDGLILTPEGKISLMNPRHNSEPMNRFASLYNEAVLRGYSREDIGFGIWPNKNSETIKRFSNPDWKRFEKIVASIHKTLCPDAEVVWSEMIKDKTGIDRQVDVTIRTKIGPYKILGIVQCKYEKRSVNIAEVESFVTTKNDLNAGFGIMVARKGFQSGALAKAKAYDIQLWTLDEAEQSSWRDEIRQVFLRIPMVSKFEFYPSLPESVSLPDGSSIETRSILIRHKDKEITFDKVLAQAVQRTTEACLILPCWMELLFPNSSLILATSVYPLERIAFYFDRYAEVRGQKEVRVPIGSSFVLKRDEGELTLSERDLVVMDLTPKRPLILP